ncbi:hypothetical protein [Curtobacterium sp. MCSS17_008]|uniref:hypothetical protein n=1 Tax=Curtobacterium sp. MCSS17_008 TaxID=2175647 RepID=UPI001C6458F0|nr:hypothetical protein [Curtobacterium sp. MCSS17_008]
MDPIVDITADRAKPEQLVHFTGRVTGLTEQASRYSIGYRSSDGLISNGYGLSPDGQFQGNARAQVGTNWVEAVVRETYTGAEWVSNRVTFEVKPDPRAATKTTLTLPANPVAKAKSPYVVRVDPSGGSTGRVDLYEYDNIGQLYRIGVGYLSNGQTTIYAATMAGQRKVIAEFAGDNRFSGSGTGANVFVPIAPAQTTEPTNAPAPVGASNPADRTPAAAQTTTSAPRQQLAYTGQNPGQALGAAAAMTAVGVLLGPARRRRRRRRRL